MNTESVQIDERPGFQNWFWGVQRFGWAGLVVVIALALAGMSGAGGRFSQGVSEAGASVVEYPTVMRLDRPETLHVQGPGAQMVLDRNILMTFDIRTIVPAPSRQSSVDAALVLVFDQTGDATITMSVTPKRLLGHTLVLQLGADRHDLSITILP